MKIKLQNLILLTLTLSLTACGVKLGKSSAKVQDDITRPPPIAASTAVDSRVRSNPDEAVSYEQWSRRNERSSADDSSLNELKKQSEAAGKDTAGTPEDDLTFEEWKKLNPIDGDSAK